MKSKVIAIVEDILNQCGSDLSHNNIAIHTNYWIRKHLGLRSDSELWPISLVPWHQYYPLKNCIVVEGNVPLRSIEFNSILIHSMYEAKIIDRALKDFEEVGVFAQTLLNVRREMKKQNSVHRDLRVAAGVLVLKMILNQLYSKLSSKNQQIAYEYTYHRIRYAVDALIDNGAQVLMVDTDTVLYTHDSVINTNTDNHNGRVLSVVFGVNSHATFNSLAESVSHNRIITTDYIMDNSRSSCKPNKNWSAYLQKQKETGNGLKELAYNMSVVVKEEK